MIGGEVRTVVGPNVQNDHGAHHLWGEDSIAKVRDDGRDGKTSFELLWFRASDGLSLGFNVVGILSFERGGGGGGRVVLCGEKVKVGVFFTVIEGFWCGGGITSVNVFTLALDKSLVSLGGFGIADQGHLVVGHPAANVHIESGIHKDETGRGWKDCLVVTGHVGLNDHQRCAGG